MLKLLLQGRYYSTIYSRTSTILALLTAACVAGFRRGPAGGNKGGPIYLGWGVHLGGSAKG